MDNKQVTISVYGREQICANCVGAPSSWETYEWLQAAINRKYKGEFLDFEYIDIDKKQVIQKHKEFITKIEEDDLFWPVILVNDEIVSEGIPHLKQVYKALDENGLELQ